MSRWKHFKKDEFRCKCGKCPNRIEDRFIDLLDRMRTDAGVPFVINSGYRCPEHNMRVSGTGPYGPHTTGLAADIAAPNARVRFQIIKWAILHGVERLGDGKTFVHIDISKAHPPEVAWLY